MKAHIAAIILILDLLFLLVSPAMTATVTADPPDPSPEPRLFPPVSTQRDGVSACYGGCSVETAPVVNADYEQRVVELVNEQRAMRCLPPLKRVAELNQAARYHATDMGQDDYFDHDSHDRSGNTLTETCGCFTRIELYYPNWMYMGENIAAGYASPESVMNGWMSSDGHRANLLSTDNWEFGVGYYGGSGCYYHYWVQDFGRRSGVYPLIINGEAATTDSQNVDLYIYGSWDEIRLRNDNDPWSTWQPFQNTLNWTLTGQAGERTVWAEMRRGSQTTTSSDTISLDFAGADPILGNLPDAIEFAYSIPDQRFVSCAFQVTPKNIGNDAQLTWNVQVQGTWFTVSQLEGTSPHSFWITPTDVSKTTVTTYTGQVTVSVTEPSNVQDSPHEIDLTLRVFDSPIRAVYLPSVVDNSGP